MLLSPRSHLRCVWACVKPPQPEIGIPEEVGWGHARLRSSQLEVKKIDGSRVNDNMLEDANKQDADRQV